MAIKYLETLKAGAGWKLGWYSYHYVFSHKKLLILPILSLTSLLVSLFIFLRLLRIADSYTAVWAYIIACYFLCIFLSLFFNVTLIAMTNDYLEGKKASIWEGFKTAYASIPSIATWTLFSGTIGLLFKILSFADEKLGIPIVTLLLGITWAGASYFVLPILCFKDEVNPFKIVHDSGHLIVKCWGSQVSRIIGSSFVTFIIGIPIYLAFAMLLFIPSFPQKIYAFWFLGFAILSLLVLGFITNGILRTLFYRHINGETLPEEIDANLIGKSVVRIMKLS